MNRSQLIHAVAAVALAASLSACQQRQEEAAGAPDADVTVTTPPDVNVNPPRDVDINPPDVNINPPDVDMPRPPETTTRESTTVTVPGVGSSTTTVEKRE